jgi:hypothetical protein
MRLRFRGYLGKPWSFNMNHPGWPGPVAPGGVVEVPDELGESILRDHAMFERVESDPTDIPVHAALEEPTADKAIKSPRKKRTTE